MSRERTAALAGVLYVALDIVVGVMAGAPPSPAAPESEIVAYIADHRAGLAVGLWLFGLATIPLLWWFGSLWVRMVHAEADTPRLAVVSLAGLLLGGTMALASAVVMATLGLLPTDAGGVVALYTLAAVFLSAAGFGLAAHLIATNVLAARSQHAPHVARRRRTHLSGCVPRSPPYSGPCPPTRRPTRSVSSASCCGSPGSSASATA